MFVGLFVWWNVNNKAFSEVESKQRFIITKGSGASVIANKLEEEKLIRNSLAFKIYVQITGNSSKIKAGEYNLSPSNSLSKIVGELLKGPSLLWVTIPEGLRREEIALRFSDGLGKTNYEKSQFMDEFLEYSLELEGYLFPDTYLVAKDITAQKTVDLMKATFTKKTSDLTDVISQSGYSEKEVLIVASLIEREAISDDERPLIADVLYKRLEADWPLQVDAAVQYAVANSKCQKLTKGCSYWEILTKEDIEINSPFNTYKYPGLPPSPISNPGLASIKAAAEPSSNDYWFYIHDTNGDIHFAETIEEHNANVRKYLGK